MSAHDKITTKQDKTRGWRGEKGERKLIIPTSNQLPTILEVDRWKCVCSINKEHFIKRKKK
jgi:hypothetical protein